MLIRQKFVGLAEFLNSGEVDPRKKIINANDTSVALYVYEKIRKLFWNIKYSNSL